MSYHVETIVNVMTITTYDISWQPYLKCSGDQNMQSTNLHRTVTYGTSIKGQPVPIDCNIIVAGNVTSYSSTEAATHLA